MKKSLGIIYAALLLSCLVCAQEKIDTKFEVSGSTILIFYKIETLDMDKDFDVSLVLKRTTVPSYSYAPAALSGDIGKGKYAGQERKIIWNLTEREKNMLDGDDFYFEVAATPKGGGLAWYYYVGTAVVGGGVAAVLLMKKKDETPAQTSSFPSPPVRP